ncbi:MAG: hypothetical protein EPO28_00800 [Saprospiraceae bacterium]|nr:MAG: hypothetical protein EPO28_00800 [Saprospiraceae bacterium]
MKKITEYINYECPLAPGYFYHVFNRSNNKELLFRSDENRKYFLKKFQEYLSPFLAVYCYCLLGNHFHLLVRIREERELENYLLGLPIQERSIAQKKLLSLSPDLRMWSDVLTSQFQRFFTGYAMAVNKQWGRQGNLFHRPFQRVAVQDENHLMWLVYYLHANPKKHGLMEDFRRYP